VYGFEAHIAANKAKTFWVMVGFTAFMGLLGWLGGFALEQFADAPSELTYFILAGCLIFAVFGSGLAYWNSDKIICAMVNARRANPNVYIEKYYIDCIEGLVLACGLPAIPQAYVIESPALNAFATGRDPQHSLICVTTGLLQHLDRQELEGVIAHEMSHIYNRDILLMGVASVLVGGVAMFSHVVLRMLQFGGGGRRSSRDRDDNGGGGAGILAIVGILFIILAPIAANLLNMMLSRKREFLADATAVKLTRNPDGLIGALSKISKNTETMPFVEQELSALFIEHPQHGDTAEGGMAAAFATHPPIAERIEALKGM
jgi:heat shock protein HtpX